MGGTATRGQIVEAADDLFYRQGFEPTSFADIAAAVGISRGNFYYHFRTKDEILDAVIGRRLAATQAMLDRWEAEGEDPAARIRGFVRLLLVNRAKIMRHGCPVGTLCNELAKLDHAAARHANRILALFRDWLAGQFAQLGHGKEEAGALALHLLVRAQGVAAVANAFRDNTFRDKGFVAREVEQMEAWLAGLR